MEKLYTQYQENEGYLTLFSCLLFLVMTSLFMVCLDAVLLYQGKSVGRTAQAGASEHLLANYDKELLERYHLLFLDQRLEDELEKTTEEYYGNFFQSEAVEAGKKSALNMKLEQCSVKTFGSMQEDECRYFIAQVTEFMKYESVKDAVFILLDETKEDAKSQSEELDDAIELLEQKEAAVQEASEENTDIILAPYETVPQEQAATKAQIKNPIETVQGILRNGVLSYVTNQDSISDTEISSSNLPSGSKKEQQIILSANVFSNIGDFKNLLNELDFDNLTSAVTEKAVLAGYGNKHFNNYRNNGNQKDTVLSYEMEYILGGQECDTKNLEYVVNRLILLRFGINAVKNLSDEELLARSQAQAIVLLGATGMPAAVEIMKYTIIGAYSMQDSIEDVKCLLAGEKVPMLYEDADALGYEEYLAILFFMYSNQERLILRMQDLIQINIEQVKNGYLIEKCRVGILMENTIIQNTNYLPGTYRFDYQEKYTY